jgi:hypothetical protein
MEPELVLGTTITAAVRAIVREELDARPASTARAAPPKSPWVTPPAAARETGVPVKTIHALRKAGRIEARMRTIPTATKGPKYLVNVEEVAEVAKTQANEMIRPPPASTEPSATLDKDEIRRRAARLRAPA